MHRRVDVVEIDDCIAWANVVGRHLFVVVLTKNPENQGIVPNTCPSAGEGRAVTIVALSWPMPKCGDVREMLPHAMERADFLLIQLSALPVRDG